MTADVIGREVARIRVSRGWSVAESAARLGRSVSWTQKFEAGHLTTLEPAIRVMVALVFGVPATHPVSVAVAGSGDAAEVFRRGASMEGA